MAFITERAGSPDICLKDLHSGSEQLLAAAPFNKSPLFLDYNGSQVVFVRGQGSNTAVVLRNVAEKTERVLTHGCPVLHDWSRDGQRLLCADGSHLFQIDIDKQRELPSLHVPRSPMLARFSPDGRWVAYVPETDQGDTTAGFIAPLDGSDESIQIFREPYTWSLHWAPSGNAVYYWSLRDGFRCLYQQPLDPTTKVPLGNALAILHRHEAQRYPWSGGTLSISSGRIAMTLKDQLANIWKVGLPR